MAAGTTIQLKRKAGAFTGGQLAAGEAGVDTTNNKLYFSKEGSTVTEVGGAGVSDGDKGDIEVSSGGTVWTVEAVNAGTVASPLATIQLKRQAGTLVDGDLAIGEAGVDTTNANLYFSSNGTTVTRVSTQADINAALVTRVTYKGTYDADADSPPFTADPVSVGIKTGDMYEVSVAGSGFHSIPLQVGDVLIADSVDPISANDWIKIQGKIAAGSIAYAKIQNVSATDKLLGRATAGAGVVEEITCTAAGRALLDDVDSSAQRTTLGLGSLATSSALTGDVTSSGSSTTLANIPAISGANLTNLNASNLSSGTVNHARLGSGGGGSTKFLREDATWQTVSGGGAEKWAPNWDGQGSVITGDVAYRAVVSTGTITSIALVGQPSGSVTMTVKKYTPSGGALGSPTTLGTGSLSSAVHSRTTGLSWSVTAGDVLEFTPSSITSITRLHVTVST